MKNLRPLGLLSPKSADKFLDLVIENSPILKFIHPAKVTNPVSTYPTVAGAQFKTRGYGTTVQGGRQTVATLNNLTQTDVSYSLKELVLALVIQDSYIEDMESDPEKVAAMVAKVFAKDLHHLFILGDTELTPATSGSPTDQESLELVLDGIVKQLTSNNLTCPWVSADSTLLKKLAKLVSGAPDDLVANPNTRLFINPSDYTTLWEDVMNNNKTLAIRDGKLWYRSWQVEEMTKIPQARPIIGDLSNIVGFMGRQVQMEVQRYPEARGFKVVLSTRVDLQQYPNANLRILAERFDRSG